MRKYFIKIFRPIFKIKLIRNVLNNELIAQINNICRKEYENQQYIRPNERPIEYNFVFKKLNEIYPQSILDVGTGTTALPHLMRNCGFFVSATDNIKDYWLKGMVNRHYHVIHDDITNTKIQNKFDLITCISVLEHILKSDDAVNAMFSLLKPKGHLILTFPYTETQYVKNVYNLSGSSAYGKNKKYIGQSFSRDFLNRWIQNKGQIIEQEYWQCWAGQYWTLGNQIIPPRKVTNIDKHQLTCVHIQKI